MPRKTKGRSNKASTAAPAAAPKSKTESSTSNNGVQLEPSPKEIQSLMNQLSSRATMDKESISKLEAKVDAVIPKSVQNSIESMVDQVVNEAGLEEKEGRVSRVIEEFTVTGNKLTPTVSVSMKVEKGASVPANTSLGGKKRPRDCPAFETDDLNLISEKLKASLDLKRKDSEDDRGDEDFSEDDDDDDDEDHVVGVCLHCGLEPPPVDNSESHNNSISTNTAPGIQVSCDDCHSFICSGCHWCHEYQANHEIRVCDRCDAFYCKKCDEMDQCEDCGEVVCGGCGSLCSCKFCGCGLCEDCATACGRCGIVLCQRDAKFAVECDTCRMSYCLVCLASGTKDPCVRCGHRTSKRVEQLVHLRLKSIYKAFKQSGAKIDYKNSGNKDGSDANSSRQSKSSNCGPDGKESGGGRSNTSSGGDPMNGDVGAMLKVAAAATASVAASGKGSKCSNPSNDKDSSLGNIPTNADNFMPPWEQDGRSHRKEPKKNESDKFASRTEEEADAAAAALLAELDEEQQQVESSSKAKKNKKKKKKERQAAREKEKEEQAKKAVEEEAKRIADELKKKKAKEMEKKSEKAKEAEETTSKKKKKKKKKKAANVKQNSSFSDSNNDESEDDDLIRLAEATGIHVNTAQLPKVENRENRGEDDIESRLANLITTNNEEGIEEVLAELKGVPGRAALRKNAKKALKRIREERAAKEEAKLQKEMAARAAVSPKKIVDNADQQTSGYKATEPLLKLVSNVHRVQPAGSQPRSECVMHMAPSVVGWVIGKGGQRIRDLMEESGAKVWIDQESMGPQEMRIVYVSGTKKSIDSAVRTIKDLVAKAPIGGTTAPTNAPVAPPPNTVTAANTGSSFTVASSLSVPNVVNDNGSVTSTRSSLTSTPVSMLTGGSHPSTPAAQKPVISPIKKDFTSQPFQHQQAQAMSQVISPQKMQAAQRSVSLPSAPSLPPGLNQMSRQGLIPPSMNETVGSGFSSPAVPKVVQELYCEPRFVPLLIGKRGWAVKNIQDTSGARVDIDQKVTPRKIIISGIEMQVKEAIRQVNEVLSYPHAQSNYSTAEADEDDLDIFASLRESGGFSSSLQQDIGGQSLFGQRQGETSNLTNLPFSYGGLGNSSEDNTLPQSSMFGYGQQMNQQSPFQTGNAFSSQSSQLNPSQNFLQRNPSAPLPSQQLSMDMNKGSIGGVPNAFDRDFLRGDSRPPQNDTASQLPGLGGVGGLFGSNQQSQNNGDIFNSIFGQPLPATSSQNTSSIPVSRCEGPDSLLPGLNDLSFGETDNNDLGLGMNWNFDGLLDDNTNDHKFGLGGVQLDQESPKRNSSHGNNPNTSSNQWGM